MCRCPFPGYQHELCCGNHPQIAGSARARCGAARVPCPRGAACAVTGPDPAPGPCGRPGCEQVPSVSSRSASRTSGSSCSSSSPSSPSPLPCASTSTTTGTAGPEVRTCRLRSVPLGGAGAWGRGWGHPGSEQQSPHTGRCLGTNPAAVRHVRHPTNLLRFPCQFTPSSLSWSTWLSSPTWPST